MLNYEFNEFATNPDLDMYPADIQDELQALNDDLIYPKVNNGVYSCGFAKSQEAYNEAVTELFESLEVLEEKLSKQRYLGGKSFTWLDLRLFMTLVRFDTVYIVSLTFRRGKKEEEEQRNLMWNYSSLYMHFSIHSSP